MQNKTFFSTITKSENQDGVFTFIATSETVDRMGDIVIAEGVDIQNYKKNPVILGFHDGHNFPIGKAVDIRKDGDRIYVDIVFAETEEGQKFKYLVENGFMKAVSIGFIPKEIYDEGGWFGKSFEELKTDYPNIYERVKPKLKKAKRVFTKSELLEISVVPVPANQDALLVMASKGFRKAYALPFEDTEELIEIELSEVKNAVKYSEHPKNMKVDTESMWDKTKAVQSLRKWASKDGSGEKDQMIWSKYRKGFGWYDANVIDNFSSYKYPHHRAEGEDFYVVWRGVVSAMVFLDRGDIPAEDRKSLYNHLARHYKEDFNREPPEYREAPRTLREAIKDYDEEHLEIYMKEIMKPEDLKQLVKEYEEEIKTYKSKLEEKEKLLSDIDKEVKSLIDELSSEDVSSTSQKKEKEVPPPSKIEGVEKNQKGTSNEDDEGIEVDENFTEVISSILDNILQEKLLKTKGGK